MNRQQAKALLTTASDLLVQVLAMPVNGSSSSNPSKTIKIMRYSNEKALAKVRWCQEVWLQYSNNADVMIRPFKGFIYAEGSPLAEIVRQLEPVAKSSRPLFILGEMGSGKTAIALHIHGLSGRTGKFIHFAAALLGAGPDLVLSRLFGIGKDSGVNGVHRDGVKGLLEEAHGGTIFLDDFHRLDARAQAFLMQVIENGRFQRPFGTGPEVVVDVRFVLACNESPDALIESGRVIAEFFSRVHTMKIQIPALRDRPQDIPAYIRFFSEIHGHSVRFAQDLFSALVWYRWPGNVRGLANFIQGIQELHPPGLASLASVSRLMALDAELIGALKQAYAEYQIACKCYALPESFEPLVVAVAEAGKRTFVQIFPGKKSGGPTGDINVKRIMTDELTALQQQLKASCSASAGPVASLPVGNCATMLGHLGLTEESVRLVIHHAWKRLRTRGVTLSSGSGSAFGPERYSAFVAFFGLPFHKVRYRLR